MLIKNQNIEADQWLSGPEGNVETDFKGVFMNLRNAGNGLSCDCGDDYMSARSCQNSKHTLKMGAFIIGKSYLDKFFKICM